MFRFSILIGSLAAMITNANAQMSPDKCRELQSMIVRTQQAADGARGASSQQQPILDALAQYRALYKSQCGG